MLGVNSGHYTSYVRHPVDQRWYYYNDETVMAQEPNNSDFSNAYILLYQRQGTVVSFFHFVNPKFRLISYLEIFN